MTDNADTPQFRTRAPRPSKGVPTSAPVLGVVPQIADSEVVTPATPSVAPKQIDAISGDILQEMRVRARDRKLQQAQELAAQAAKAQSDTAPKRWLYNSNTENISEFPESFLIVEDGYFEYTPAASFPFTDDEKDVHLEFCRSRVNTRPIDGVANAKQIRNNAAQIIAQVQYLPPQPQSVERAVLTLETVV